MTLDATKPTDQELVSVLPYWIKNTRSGVNSLIAGITEITTTDLTISAGDTALVIGTDLTAIAMEIVLLSGLGAATIDQIRGGTEGQLKIFIFQGNNVSFKDGPKSNGQLYLNQLPVLSTFNAQQDDVIALINIDGDGSSNYGYWKEVW
ncbi:MAG: hypothetical protein ACTSX2_03055, partial [Candidatus Thorarchaeota archaeon]